MMKKSLHFNLMWVSGSFLNVGSYHCFRCLFKASVSRLRLWKKSRQTRQKCVRECVRARVCASLASDSSETVEVIIVSLGRLTASEMKMHDVLIILILIFIQGHTDLNHRIIINVWLCQMLFNQCPSRFLWRCSDWRVCATIISPVTLTFIQGHKCVSNLTTF